MQTTEKYYFLMDTQVGGQTVHENWLTLPEAKECFDNLVEEYHDNKDSEWANAIQRIDVYQHITEEDQENGISQWDYSSEYCFNVE